MASKKKTTRRSKARRTKKKAAAPEGAPSAAATSPAPADEDPAESEPQRTGGTDAVCFTAGLHGFAFSAGAIHAYLAADRRPPEVVAGVSLGAVNAAAMRKCYAELARAREKAEEAGPPDQDEWLRQREVARWRWYRQYVQELSHEPYAPIRESMPSLIDFFSDRPPVNDNRPSVLPEEDRKDAVWQRVLQIKTGQWISRFPVSVGALAKTCVAYVRSKESYPGYAWWRRVKFWWRAAGVALRTLLHVALRVVWVNREATTEFKHPLRVLHRYRPLVGWKVQLSAWGILGALLASGGAPLYQLLASLAGWDTPGAPMWWLYPLAATLLGAVAAWLGRNKLGHGLPLVLAHMGAEQALAHDFHLRSRLYELFGEESFDLEADPGVASAEGAPPRLLAVVTPLQTGISEDGSSHPARRTQPRQCWMPRGTVVDALRASLALPPLLEPVLAEESHADCPRQLIDASTVRQNPLPALFRFLKQNRSLAQKMSVHAESDGAERWEEKRSSIHVVYNVPVGPEDTDERTGEGNGQVKEEECNIVDVARLSMKLAQRRDTHMEVEQTNFISSLERLSWLLADERPEYGADVHVFPLFADEIAPAKDLNELLKNRLAPGRREILRCVAAGCRETLRTLYARRLRDGSTTCSDLISSIAPHRGVSGCAGPGLPEVCAECEFATPPGRRPDGPSNGRKGPPDLAAPAERDSDYAPELPDPASWFPQLTGDRPRIVFAASGGVFRGSFHVGVAGALYAAGIKPDLIAGASVGTLLGGGVAALFRAGPEAALDKLAELVTVFVEIDERVALTRRLKRACRDLGIRARSVPLSPAAIRRMVKRGGRADPSFATTGAPAALIDALSDLFLIPRGDVHEAAATFVAGKVGTAVHTFLELLKVDALRRLDVEEELMGAELLEGVAAELLGLGENGKNGQSLQPYRDDDPERSIGMIATATDLGRERPVMFGCQDERALAGFDFLQAALASSAFPAVFAPRRETRVFSGQGHPDVRYGDGGIFNNLPILPAVRLLSYVQRQAAPNDGEWWARLERRHDSPDLVIVGALDANPGPDAPEAYCGLIPTLRRAKELRANNKIRAIENSSEMIHSQIGRLLELDRGRPLDSEDGRFVESVVDAAILPVFPTDAAHLSGTFEFCASLGLDREKVRTAIADGCYRTLGAFAEDSFAEEGEPGWVASKAIRSLRQRGRVPPLQRAARDRSAAAGTCPYFVREGAELPCPFAQREPSRGVHEACRRDEAHA